MRLIDADSLIRLVMDSTILGKGFKQAFVALVNGEPTAQPEQKKGKWIPQDHNKHHGMISTTVYYFPRCSVCGESANYTNFCPNCGADMREDQDG